MTRSNPSKLYAYDPKIDRTFHRLIRSPMSDKCFASDLGVLKFDSGDFDFDFDMANFYSNIGVSISKFSLDNMLDNNCTLKELATPDVMCQPCELEHAQSYELKYELIHLVPKFHVVCSTMRSHRIPEDYIKMKAFPFSLNGVAKDWLYLQPTLFNA
ncbi:hypothetical protein CR513_60463, partial [Mucuna pruriens]